MNRPDFREIKSYEDFLKYYWYREELKEICKELGIDDTGNKKELNDNIKSYFEGNLIQKKTIKKYKLANAEITLDSKLLKCGFCFNQKFRDFFSNITGVNPFKFHADMVETWKEVKKREDYDFTIKDMLDIYYRRKVYAIYDKSSCEWNRFFSDFCNDEVSHFFSDKLKTAAILWKKVRISDKEKKYQRKIVFENFEDVKLYLKKKDTTLEIMSSELQ